MSLVTDLLKIVTVDQAVNLSRQSNLKTSVKSLKSVGKASVKIPNLCRERNTITISELTALIDISERPVERNIQQLQAKGLLRRVGGRKEGHWEVLEL